MADSQNVIDLLADHTTGLLPPEDASDEPPLLVEPESPDVTVIRLRDVLAASGELYDRGVPVRVANDATNGGAVVHPMTADGLIRETHRFCRPYRMTAKGPRLVQLPRNVAGMYLDWHGEWNLPVLNGIASTPLLSDDGSIHAADGYEPISRMWCENVPGFGRPIPQQPTREDAHAALTQIRGAFRTFCFADAATVIDPSSGLRVVDLGQPPGMDESGFLAALLTAVCRPSLHLAPGILFCAASISGAGAGKGLLARCISIIAFGREPHAVTAGFNSDELDKRIAAELMAASPVLFLDNLNNTAVKSDLLASAITERPARVRVLGKSQMVQLNASCLVMLTGNGLRVSEDLARRFIKVEFDAGMENPETREFPIDIRSTLNQRRMEMLAALLTIWRFGRTSELPAGQMMGSFEQWCSWVRDPLLALGCQDPARRIAEAKEQDTRRQEIKEFFESWWQHHGDNALPLSQLDPGVKWVIDPQDRGRQYVNARVQALVGTRASGFILTRQSTAGKWGVATFALSKTDEPEGHGAHRGHRSASGPMTPKPPMREDATDSCSASRAAAPYSGRI